MNRRNFLHVGAAGAAGLALSGLNKSFAAEFADQKKLRVGLIGTGWYGKCDLWRLCQVAPVEIVSLCDVDQRMLAQAADPRRKGPVCMDGIRLYLVSPGVQRRCPSRL